jgi:hypothetical protein
MTGENGRRVFYKNGEDQEKSVGCLESLCAYVRGKGLEEKRKREEREGNETKLNFQAAANQSL